MKSSKKNNAQTSPTPPEEGLKRRGYITANPASYGVIKNFRSELKKNPTEAESILWSYLKNKKTGYKIRRQHVIDDFIVDFVCLTKKLVIEVDGKIHDQQKVSDEVRTIRLNVKGYQVTRFMNDEVLENPESVAERIKIILDNK